MINKNVLQSKNRGPEGCVCVSNLLLKQSIELSNEYPSWRTETKKISEKERVPFN